MPLVVPPALLGDKTTAAELWTDKMEDEVNFQKAKRQKRLVDAARENQVLPKERDTGLDVAVRAAVGREAAAHVRGGCLVVGGGVVG